MGDYLVIGIAGGSGSGKTTLTNQIAAQFLEQVTVTIRHMMIWIMMKEAG